MNYLVSEVFLITEMIFLINFRVLVSWEDLLGQTKQTNRIIKEINGATLGGFPADLRRWMNESYF